MQQAHSMGRQRWRWMSTWARSIIRCARGKPWLSLRITHNTEGQVKKAAFTVLLHFRAKVRAMDHFLKAPRKKRKIWPMRTCLSTQMKFQISDDETLKLVIKVIVLIRKSGLSALLTGLWPRMTSVDLRASLLSQRSNETIRTCRCSVPRLR